MHRCLPLIDPNKVFRFLDLPPELRLRIYDEVLEIKTNELGERDSIFSPQLLRASKQCLAESEPVLYGRNKLTINIESELRFMRSEDYYHDNISIEIGGRVVAHGGSRASLGFPVCMAASWPACVQKARDIRIKLDAIDMRGNKDLENLIWFRAFPRLVEESIRSRGGGFVPLWQLTASLAQAATRCKSLHIVSSFVDPHSDGTSLKIDRALSGMAAFANVTKCEVDTVGDPSEGVRLRALILGPVPNRSEQPISTDRVEPGRNTHRTVARDSRRAWYENPALLSDGLYQVANVDDREEPERGSTPEFPDDIADILQPLLTLKEPPRPRDLVLWRTT